MFGLFATKSDQEAIQALAALMRTHALIEFEPDGKIITANQNFLDAMEYRLDELKGRRHEMFLAPQDRDSAAYRDFWTNLSRGNPQSGEFKRIAKSGREVWLEAAYTPVHDNTGKVVKIIKLATDITARKSRLTALEGQIDAINKSQAVIEFGLDGKVITANANFLHLLDYRLEEIVGQHHQMFVDPAYRSTAEYRAFWAKLGRGEYDMGEYKRLGKGSKEVWIQASYNPILDASGRPQRVVKFATDITEQKLRNADYEGQIAAISKSMAIIEFKLDGTIVRANQNFLNVLGYSAADVEGRHHAMFIEPAQRDTPEYREFWRRLANGEYQAGEFKRIAKNGR